MLYSLSISCKPITYNAAYPTGRNGRRFLSEEGKLYKEFINGCCHEQITEFVVPKNASILKSLYIFCKPEFVTSQGKSSKNAGDADGMVKLFQDAVSSALDINDSIIWDTRVIKCYQETPRIFAEFKWEPIDKYFTPYDFLNQYPSPRQTSSVRDEIKTRALLR